jgi:hypothetical protein
MAISVLSVGNVQKVRLMVDDPTGPLRYSASHDAVFSYLMQISVLFIEETPGKKDARTSEKRFYLRRGGMEQIPLKHRRWY